MATATAQVTVASWSATATASVQALVVLPSYTAFYCRRNGAWMPVGLWRRAGGVWRQV